MNLCMTAAYLWCSAMFPLKHYTFTLQLISRSEEQKHSRESTFPLTVKTYDISSRFVDASLNTTEIDVVEGNDEEVRVENAPSWFGVFMNF